MQAQHRCCAPSRQDQNVFVSPSAVARICPPIRPCRVGDDRPAQSARRNVGNRPPCKLITDRRPDIAHPPQRRSQPRGPCESKLRRGLIEEQNTRCVQQRLEQRIRCRIPRENVRTSDARRSIRPTLHAKALGPALFGRVPCRRANSRQIFPGREIVVNHRGMRDESGILPDCAIPAFGADRPSAR